MPDFSQEKFFQTLRNIFVLYQRNVLLPIFTGSVFLFIIAYIGYLILAPAEAEQVGKKIKNTASEVSFTAKKNNKKKSEQSSKLHPVPFPLGYKLTSGTISKIATPLAWKSYAFKKILKANKPGAKILLPDGTTVSWVGILAITGNKRSCSFIEGQAELQVAKKHTPFTLQTRPGNIKVLGTNFTVEVEEHKPIQKKKQDFLPGDNSAQLLLEVKSGKISFLAYGKKQPQIFQQGEKGNFQLAEVRRHGKVQTIGFGISDKSGAKGKLLKKRAAYSAALRSLSEFITGMRFSIQVHQNRCSFIKSEFRSSAKIDKHKVQLAYKNFSSTIMLCRARMLSKCEQPVKRRNCLKKRGKAIASLKLYKSIPMAFLGVRNKAILKIIQQSALDYFGSLPKQIKGIFYPDSFMISKKDDKIRAIIRGEVLFE